MPSKRMPQAQFGEEDDLMRSTACSSFGCHVDEQAAVMKCVAEVIEPVKRGGPALGTN
jgi:hemerythrin